MVDHGSQRPWRWDADPDRRFPSPLDLFSVMRLDQESWRAERLEVVDRRARGPAGRVADVRGVVVVVRRTA